jgi:hypothetical protein
MLGICEHGANQLLGDDNSDDEIENTKLQLGETKEPADEEIEYRAKED